MEGPRKRHPEVAVELASELAIARKNVHVLASVSMVAKHLSAPEEAAAEAAASVLATSDATVASEVEMDSSAFSSQECWQWTAQLASLPSQVLSHDCVPAAAGSVCRPRSTMAPYSTPAP